MKGTVEERERQKYDALNQWQGLAKPWMVEGENGIKDKRPSYEEWSAELRRVKQLQAQKEMAEMEDAEELARLHRVKLDADRKRRLAGKEPSKSSGKKKKKSSKDKKEKSKKKKDKDKSSKKRKSSSKSKHKKRRASSSSSDTSSSGSSGSDGSSSGAGSDSEDDGGASRRSRKRARDRD